MLTAGRRALVILILFSLAVAASASLVHAHSSSSTPGQTVSQAARTRAAQLTNDLIYLNAQYQLAGSRQKAQLEADLVATALARKQELLALVDSDPGAMLGLVLTSNLRSSLPASVSQHIEEEVDIEGVLEILHEDRYDGSRYHYGLQTASGRLSLHFGEDPPTHLLSGARIRAHGFRLDGTLALGSGSKNVQTVTAAPSPSTLGARKTLVILVTFQDNPVQPYTIADAQTAVFGTTSNFFVENSYQQTWLAGDVYGWFTIAVDSTVCDANSIATGAQAAATAAGANLSSYSHYVYAFPRIGACTGLGYGTVGGNPSQAWIIGDLDPQVVAHELGHNLGLWHSHAWDCGTAVLGTTCTTFEYGDAFDAMGNSYPGHFNAFQKERLAWLNSGVSPPITTVMTSGTYTLDAYELVGTQAKALKILKSTDPSTGLRTWYYVESRQAVGFDAFLADYPNVLGGVLIHTGSESSGDSSYLLDMTPASGILNYLDWSNPALVTGQTFSDDDASVTITTEWVTTGGAAVTVRFGASSSASQPTVTVSTDQASYTRGQTVSVTARVTSAGLPVPNASVSFTVTRSNGTVVNGVATTGSDGTAVFKLRLRKQDPVGTYQAAANALKSSISGSGATSFTVR